MIDCPCGCGLEIEAVQSGVEGGSSPLLRSSLTQVPIHDSRIPAIIRARKGPRLPAPTQIVEALYGKDW